MVKNPLNRDKLMRVNDMYDNQDFIIPNAISQDKQFKDVDKTTQLTQNAWNFSPYTREDAYRDVVVDRPVMITRLGRYKGVLNPAKYHNHGMRRW